ncbi:MAG: serine/threonine-protein phosphatase [Alphaproteobacteria bacterium]|nr:serine/threonine-protein phosphatase [Alphaproteobacteria bacterium]
MRTENQDAVLALDGNGLWAVSDGVGGLARGEVASAAVIETLDRGASSASVDRALLCTLLEEANRTILEIAKKHAPGQGMAATAAVLSTVGERYFCAWAGDCRVYRFDGEKLIQLTHDHRFVQELIDRGMLDEKAARSHPRRNVVTRALGVDDALLIDECEGAVAAGDVFVLTTDGVTGVLEDGEIVRLLKGSSPQEAVDAMMASCLERTASDNLSVIVVRAETA